MLKILIADDDKNMRFVLKKALSKLEDLQIIAEASSGHEAVGTLENHEIDVAFLDIDMPGLDGIETAKLILDIQPKCIIVFVTAHGNYMSEAFELYAYDYIVKPFKIERLHKTIARINESLAITNHEELKTEKPEELLFKLKDGMVLIKPEEIIMIERENRSTVIITDKAKYVTTKTLQEMEQILPKADFIRSHKSYILRIDKISTISVYGRWTYIVKFKNCNRDALLTKEKAGELEDRFGFKKA